MDMRCRNIGCVCLTTDDNFYCVDCTHVFKGDKKPEQALRYNAGKLPLDELDPLFLEEMFEVIKYGQKKYARMNWMKGAPATQYFGCIMRHLLKWYRGEDIDEESGCTHLGHIACNVMMAMYSLRIRKENDDRPFKAKILGELK